MACAPVLTIDTDGARVDAWADHIWQRGSDPGLKSKHDVLDAGGLGAGRRTGGGEEVRRCAVRL